ncbi:MAG: GTP-binding protein [Desulfobulbus sp.]|nr:GTP-binding protein [Desulfobulbus sp.]
MLGAFSVGKTSLVERYVHSVFSDKYLSTIGVKISKKIITVADQEVSMILWDMEGRDIFTDVNINYLRGAMGFFVVADGTRAETLDTALELRALVLGKMGTIPNALLINKDDLADQWEISEDMLQQTAAEGITVFRTSAKTGQSVEEAFQSLAKAMLKVGRNV